MVGGIVGVAMHYLRFGPKETEMIERYQFHERICHWLTGIAYVYCLATGLAFYSPYLFWLAVMLGGGPTSRFWHPWLGLVFVAAQLWMHRIWRNDVHYRSGGQRVAR